MWELHKWSAWQSALTQLYPSTPQFTETNVPDLSGRVCIVTGANTGVGKEVASILYSKNAIVYATSRSEEKGLAAIAAIKEQHPSSMGRLELLPLDLADLSTIKGSAETFLQKEDKLHLLINNAGVMFPPDGSKTAQGYELQLGVNCLGPFLFTRLLTPLMVKTAQASVPASVRVVWVSSSAAEMLSPRVGVDMTNLDYNRQVFYPIKYGTSKAGNYFHSTEFAKRHRDDGIISVALNPGNLRSDLDRHVTGLIERTFRALTVYPAINGAYTELFAALSPDVTMETSGGWIIPWGRILHIRADLQQGAKSESEGGTGLAESFWKWSEDQVREFM
ncbi:short-chain dehydrogenase [Plectosphaerella plurivora]|uniref:Short-chain dehydrogenase n=1 Tax=Plectosphaerella plurivora TaxID=936078 RepID=A0A9P9A6T6_9PEZI|nr:short-chain dehydrogenase [Plectosphaerella plurivora]